MSISLEQLRHMEMILKANEKRHHVLFLLCTYTGLKLSDILLLTVEKVKSTHIVIREKHSNRPRRVIIHPDLAMVLDPFVKDKPDNHFIIQNTSHPDSPLPNTKAITILKKAAKKAGIEEFDEDSLRKTFGHELYKQGVDMELIQEILGEPSREALSCFLGLSDCSFLVRRFGEVT